LVVQRAEAEQRLEAGERGAVVVAKDELVEIDRQVIGRDTAVSGAEPGLEVRGGAAGERQSDLAVGAAPALLDRAVVIAGAAQAAVPVQPSVRTMAPDARLRDALGVSSHRGAHAARH
jgi:hypothetical protein